MNEDIGEVWKVYRNLLLRRAIRGVLTVSEQRRLNQAAKAIGKPREHVEADLEMIIHVRMLISKNAPQWEIDAIQEQNKCLFWLVNPGENVTETQKERITS